MSDSKKRIPPVEVQRKSSPALPKKSSFLSKTVLGSPHAKSSHQKPSPFKLQLTRVLPAKTPPPLKSPSSRTTVPKPSSAKTPTSKTTPLKSRNPLIKKAESTKQNISIKSKIVQHIHIGSKPEQKKGVETAYASSKERLLIAKILELKRESQDLHVKVTKAEQARQVADEKWNFAKNLLELVMKDKIKVELKERIEKLLWPDRSRKSEPESENGSEKPRGEFPQKTDQTTEFDVEEIKETSGETECYRKFVAFKVTQSLEDMDTGQIKADEEEGNSAGKVYAIPSFMKSLGTDLAKSMYG